MLQDLEVSQPLCSAAQRVIESPKHGAGESRSQAAPERCLAYIPFPLLLPSDLNPAPLVLACRQSPGAHTSTNLLLTTGHRRGPGQAC